MRKVTRREMLQYAATGVVAAALAGCSQAAAPAPESTKVPTAVPANAPTKASQPAAAGEVSGKVTVWYDSGAAWSDAIKAINTQFAEKYPKVQVEWVNQDAAQHSAKLVAAFAAKQGPDIDLGAQGRLVAAELQFNAWEDLSDELATDPEMQDIVAHLPKALVDSYYRDKKLWGLPQVAQSVGIFVRKSWLDKLGAKPPTDWQELTDLAARFTNEDPDGNGVADTFGYCIFGAPGATNSAATQFEYSAAAAGMQYPIVDLDGKPSFNTPVGVEVAKWMRKWQLESKVTSPATTSWTHVEFYAGVQAGQCGMGRIGAWNIGSWAKSALGTDYVVVDYPPMTKDQKEPNYQVAWSNAIAMSASAKDKEATLAFLKFLMSKEGQTVFYSYLTSSARTDLDWPTLTKGDPALMYFTEPQTFATDLAYMDTFSSTIDILAGHLNAMLADPSIDPAKALADAETEAIAKYNEIRKQ